MDVARAADPAVVGLGHERHRAAVLLGDLLRPVLVHDVMVARRHRVGVAKRDLVLTRPGLGLGRLDRDAGRLHALAELADERLVEAGSEQVRVGHVPGGGAQLRVPVRMCLCVALAQEEELELRADLGLEAGRSGPFDLLRQDPSRRLLDGASVEPARVADHERRRLVPGDAPERAEIRAQQEVAVAELDARDRVAGRRVRLDIEGEERVAHVDSALCMLGEIAAGRALADEAAVHVDERDDDRVDRPRLDLGAQLVEREHRQMVDRKVWCRRGRRRPSMRTGSCLVRIGRYVRGTSMASSDGIGRHPAVPRLPVNFRSIIYPRS